MTFNDTRKYVLKVWITTLVVGSLLTFSILSVFTTFASEIRNPLDLIATSFMISIISALVTIPVVFIFYTLTEIVLIRKLTNYSTKALLVFIAAFLMVIFFVLVFGHGSHFLWTFSSTSVFFYCYFAILTISILTYNLNSRSKGG